MQDVLQEIKSPGLAKVIADTNAGHFDSDEAEEQAAQAHLDLIKKKRALKAKAKELDIEYQTTEKEAEEVHAKKLQATMDREEVETLE